MHKIETIKQIQELAKSVGLDKDWHFKDVMAINTDNNETTKEYFLSLIGKCYAIKTSKPISLLHGFEDGIEYNKVLDVRITNNTVVVNIMQAKTSHYNNSLTYSAQSKISIPNPFVNYYDAWAEITNDEFDNVYYSTKNSIEDWLKYHKKK